MQPSILLHFFLLHVSAFRYSRRHGLLMPMASERSVIHSVCFVSCICSSRTSGGESRLHYSQEHSANSAAASGAARSGIYKEEGFVHGLNSVLSVRFSNTNSRTNTNTHTHTNIHTNSTNNCNSNNSSSSTNHLKNSPRHNFSLVFKDPEVETAYGEFLRKARAKRLVVVGILTIVLNTLYDLPEWTAIFTSPLMEQSPSDATDSLSAAAAAKAQQPHASSLSTGLLLALDVVEVLLQVVLAAAGYLPVLKRHTERAAVSLMLSAFFLSTIRPATLLLKNNQTTAPPLTSYTTDVFPHKSATNCRLGVNVNAYRLYACDVYWVV